MKENKDCFFCEQISNKSKGIFVENDFCIARWDDFPVSQGHLEVIPKRHIESFFELTPEELSKLFLLLNEAKDMIQIQFHPEGYNIGINEGEAAGRTIPHMHIHLIPRYKDDVENPRGGIRNIIPGKGSY